MDWTIFKNIFISIFLEAIPFVLIGVVLAALVQMFVSEDMIRRIMPGHPVGGVLFGTFLGILFPICECGMIPVIHRLLKKGMPLYIAVVFLISGPIINPVVFLSTYMAFRAQPEMVYARMGLAFLVAVTVGWIIYRTVVTNPLKHGLATAGGVAVTSAPNIQVETEEDWQIIGDPLDESFVRPRKSAPAETLAAETASIETVAQVGSVTVEMVTEVESVTESKTPPKPLSEVSWQAIEEGPEWQQRLQTWWRNSIMWCKRVARLIVGRLQTFIHKIPEVTQWLFETVKKTPEAIKGFPVVIKRIPTGIRNIPSLLDRVPRKRIAEFFGHTSHEFLDVSKYVLLGCLITAAVHTLLSRDFLVAVGDGAVSSNLFMMGFAYILSICSTSDAFVASSFVVTFSSSSILAFLVFGAMIDLKTTIMLLSVFRTKFVLYLLLLVAVAVFFGSLLVGALVF